MSVLCFQRRTVARIVLDGFLCGQMGCEGCLADISAGIGVCKRGIRTLQTVKCERADLLPCAVVNVSWRDGRVPVAGDLLC